MKQKFHATIFFILPPFRIKDAFIHTFAPNTKSCMGKKEIIITCSFVEDDLEVSWVATFTAEADDGKEDSDGEEDEK